jgi:hypothetical protein
MMAEATVDAVYLSAGGNRYTAVADWADDGCVAFGADNNVCLWHPTVSDLVDVHFQTMPAFSKVHSATCTACAMRNRVLA